MALTTVLTTVALLPVLIAALWMYTASVTKSSFPLLTNKRICLLIAHPDDEAMFFAPAVIALAGRETGNHVKILCLSSGDADGLGSIRRKELAKSALHLGLRTEEDVYVVEDPQFQDSQTATWPSTPIASLLVEAFAASLSTTPASKPPTASIDVLITFDGSGVSGHPNHISLYNGAREFLRRLTKGHPGWESPVTLYTLHSVGIGRKYLGVLDVVTTMLDAVIKGMRNANGKGGKGVGGKGGFLLYVSGLGDWRRAQTAMVSAHASQMRWFRWGWIGFSRYMVVNDLRIEKVRWGEK